MTKTTMTRGWVMAGALALAIGLAHAETRGCYKANVPGPMVLPDGSVHAQGVLRVCADRRISPVSTLHRSYVDGHPAGMFMSVPREIEDSVESGSAQLVFVKEDDALHLLGYVVSGRDGTTFYEMTRRGGLTADGSRGRRTLRHREDAVVLIASRR